MLWIILPSNLQPITDTSMTFLAIDGISQLPSIKSYFEANSVLKFTYKLVIKKSIPSLDVLLHRYSTSNKLQTTIYWKSNNTGEWLNYNSFCPLKYKTTVIKTFIHKASVVRNSRKIFLDKVERIRKLLVNNSFPINIIHSIVSTFIDKKMQQSKASDNKGENI